MLHVQSVKKIVTRIAVAAASTVVAGTAFAAATGPDLTSLSSAVQFDTVITAVLAIAGSLAVVYVAVKGAKIGLSMLKGS